MKPPKPKSKIKIKHKTTSRKIDIKYHTKKSIPQFLLPEMLCLAFRKKKNKKKPTKAGGRVYTQSKQTKQNETRFRYDKDIGAVKAGVQITMINRQRATVENVDDLQELMGNVSWEIKSQGKNKKTY